MLIGIQPRSPGQGEHVRPGPDPGDGDGRVGALVRPGVQPDPDLGVVLGHPVAPAGVLADARRRIVPQVQDLVQDVPGQGALSQRLRIEVQQLEVAQEPAGADAPGEAPARHLVELGDALGQHQRVVVGQAVDPGAQHDPLRAGQGLGDEEVGAGDVLPLRGEVLADPRLPEAERLQGHDLRQVHLHRLRQVRARRMEGHGEVAEFASSSAWWPPVAPMVRGVNARPGGAARRDQHAPGHRAPAAWHDTAPAWRRARRPGPRASAAATVWVRASRGRGGRRDEREHPERLRGGSGGHR